MRLQSLLAMLLLPAVLLLIAHPVFPTPQSCTVFMISDGVRSLGGGNEDQGAFPARAWFMPASDGRHGRVYFGFERVAESGMNDQGLFYDSLSTPAIDVPMEEGCEIHAGMWTLHAMETCSTVEEVVALVERIAIPGVWTDKVFFGDSRGNAIIVEGKQILRPDLHYQISTNFVQSATPPDEITCDRYLTAEEMLRAMETVSLAAVSDVFEATASTYHDGSGTAYTTIYDTRSKTITVYFWRDFEHPIRFDLEDELARGAHVVELVNLAPTNRARERWVASAQSELDGLIEARIDDSVDLDDIAHDIIGHYAVHPDIGLLPLPPVAIDSVSVVWASERPLLVVVPEGIAFDLYPAGNDVWFHTNITMKPEMDLAFERSDDGRVVGALLRIDGIGDVRLVKTADEPQFEPLPTQGITAPEPEPIVDDSVFRSVGLPVLIGVLAAVAVALLLRK